MFSVVRFGSLTQFNTSLPFLIQPGNGAGEMGPVIDKASHDKILKYITTAEKDGAEILLDGRSWKRDTGCWIGPTIILHKSSSDKTMCEEVFGPVLSIYQCSSWEEAVEIENANPFGNAASIYTTNGANAEWFTSRFRAAMLGVNIGIPVPREPFSYVSCSVVFAVVARIVTFVLYLISNLRFLLSFLC